MAVTDIEIDEQNPAIIYASFGGATSRRVFRLVKTPTSPPTFTAQDITSDLPIGRAVRTIAVDRFLGLTVYAGTDKGVFRGRSIDGGTTWFWVPYTKGSQERRRHSRPGGASGDRRDAGRHVRAQCV